MKQLSNKLIFTALALAVSSAYAEDPVVPSGTLERVVVTAQKRVQTTLDIAQSMSVVSGNALEKEQVSSFSDYLKLVPGLQLTQSAQGAGRLILRGVNAGGVASTVAVYADETPFGSSSGLVNGGILAADFDTFDLARIEVLRGPQGALYGASSLGGLLKYVTNLPNKDRFEMRARVGAASVHGGGTSFKTNLMVNAPISDTLAFRVTGSFNKEPGFIDSIGTAGSNVTNDINSSKNKSVRASLLYTPNNAVSLRLTASLQKISTDGSNTVEADATTLQPLYGRQSRSEFVPTFKNVDYKVYNATLNWDLGSATLTSSTSASRQDQSTRDDLTTYLSGTVAVYPAPGLGPNNLAYPQSVNLRKFTQEVRLASNTSGTFDWLAGAYFSNEDSLFNQNLIAVKPGTLDPITPQPNLILVDLKSKFREVAGFGNVTVHLGQKVDVDLGVRFSKNKQSNSNLISGVFGGADPTKFGDSSESVFTYSVAPKYKISDNVAVYARLATGYRPGGPNVVPPAAPPGYPTSFKSDSVKSLEVGFKSYTVDGKYSLEASAFNIKWKDIQVVTTVNDVTGPGNGSGATIDGLEFTLAARPVSGLGISLNGAYTNARLDADDAVNKTFAGDKLPYVPTFSLGLNGDYRWSIGQGSAAYMGASLRHVSEQKTAGFDATYRIANGKQRLLPGYNVVDLRAGVDQGKWSFDAYVKNLNNSDGVTSVGGLRFYPKGAIGVGVLTPRTVGFTVTREL